MTAGSSGTLRRWAGNPARQVLALALAVGISTAFVHYAVEDQLVIAGVSEEAYLDHLTRTLGKERAPGAEEVLLVQFDEDTFRALNTPYQQLTPHLVKLVDLLRQGEAKVIGMDMGFASFRESGDHEAFLATCQARDDVVFTSEIQVGKAVPLLTQPVQTMIERARPPLGFANLHLGDPAFVSQVNRGKVVRLVPVHHPSATPWSFAVELARRARKLRPDQVHASDTEIRLGERSLPLERGMLRVDYRGFRGLGAIAAENLLTGKLPPRMAKGRVVLVGSNWRGLGDWHQTPFGDQNGLRVQAAATYTLLAGRPAVPMSGAIGRGSAVAVALLVGLAFAWCPRWVALGAALALMGALHAGTLAAFQAGRWIPNFFAVMAAPVTGVLLWGLDLRRRPEVRLQRVVASAVGGLSRPAPSAAPEATLPGGAPVPAAPEPTDGDIVLRIAREVVGGRYEGATLLGRGGMGVVLRAFDPRRQQQVAVKILSPLLCDRPQLVTRFMREIKALQQLEHPGVVRILDVGDSESTPYYAMELVDGRDLKQVMKEGPFELQRVRDVFAQLLEVLAHIHAHGVIHRDLKPDNVLLMAGDKVKLLDFGLAHIPEASTLTQDGEVMGTLRYMSPEQMEGVELTPASDVFSIALVIFEAMTGKMPFPEIGRVLHHSGTITAAVSMRPEVPPAVSTLLMRSVSPVPGNRPADAAAFHRAWIEAWS